MSVALSVLEAALSRRVGDYLLFTGSGGAAAGATVTTTDTEVLSRPGQYWVPYILHPVTGTANNLNKYRQISDFAVATGTGTFTPVNAFPAQAVNNDTFRIHRWPVTWKYEAISDMLREAGDCLPRIIVEEFLSGELLHNPNMEQWSNNVPYDWETVAGTVTRETSTVYQGASSLKLVGTTSSVRQRIILEQECNGYTLVVTGYVNGKIANSPALRIIVGGTNTTSSTVAVDDTWEQLTASVAIADATKHIYISLINSHATEGAYFDALHLELHDSAGNDIATTTIPVSTAFERLAQVWTLFNTSPSATVQDWSNAIRPFQHIVNGYGRLRDSIAAGYPMRLVGLGVWPELSASTDTVDIEIHQVPLVANRAGQKLMMKAISHDHLGDTKKWQEILAMLVAEEPRLIARLGVIPPTQHLPTGFK